MDPTILLIEAVSGALGANINAKLVRPQELDGSFIYTVVGVIGGLLGGHFLSPFLAEAMNNPTGAAATVAGMAGFALGFIPKKFRSRDEEVI